MDASDNTESTLANVLSGILYNFRIVGCLEDGSFTEPSEPSDPFVINLPGTFLKNNRIKKVLFITKKIHTNVFYENHTLSLKSLFISFTQLIN